MRVKDEKGENKTRSTSSAVRELKTTRYALSFFINFAIRMVPFLVKTPVFILALL